MCNNRFSIVPPATQMAFRIIHPHIYSIYLPVISIRAKYEDTLQRKSPTHEADLPSVQER